MIDAKGVHSSPEKVRTIVESPLLLMSPNYCPFWECYNATVLWQISTKILKIWQRIHMDFAEKDGVLFFVVVNAHSICPEYFQLHQSLPLKC